MSHRRDGNKSVLTKQSTGSKFSSGLSAFSFKALEEEEDNDDDLTIFTGKFDKVVEEAHKQKANTERSPSTETNLSKLHTSSKSVDDDKSSPKKNKTLVFEYKEIITGLKEKITDTKEKITESINKKLEEFSNDSSPTFENVKVISEVTDHRLNSNIVDKLADGDKDDVIRVERCERVHSSPSVLSSSDETFDDFDDSIEVIESYFGDEPVEDFTGEIGISLRGTAARTKSKSIKGLGKKVQPKSSATVSMSKLIPTSDEEINSEKEFENENEINSCLSQSDNLKNNVKSASILVKQHSSDYSVPWQKITSVSVILFAFFIIPMPTYISGLIIGIILASIGWYVYLWLIEPPVLKPTIEIIPLDKLPQLQIPQMKEPSKESGVYKGWMNELMEYNPQDYHINQTHSIFVVLEGTHLRLQRPKVNMPKRAMWDESFLAPKFIHQRHLELKDSRIFLMPPGLVSKRLWSKKYPICIALSPEKGSSKNNSNDAQKKTSPDEEIGFEMITEEKCSTNILYLFARTGPEKEEWYKRFLAASNGKPLGNHILDIYKALSFNTSKLTRKPSDSSLKHKRQSSNDSISSISSLSDQPPSPSTVTDNTSPTNLDSVDLQSFACYMGHLMPSSKECKSSSSSPSRPSHFTHDPADIRQISGSLICDPQLIWLNSLIGRCFWDFLRDQWWAEKVREKLQKKLSKIHVPYFIEELQVTHIDMGFELPVIRRAGNPYIDEQGFWVDLDIVYNGGFQMTIETKINLMKLRKTPVETFSSEIGCSSHSSPVTDSNEEDSAESSTDEDEDSPVPTATDGSSPSGGTSRKFLKYIDKIAQSKYFQQAYEYKYFKKAMEGVSNTPLVLTVEVNNLVGCIAVNIPPPPTDRLWYGFRGNPTLALSAKPKVGEREVTITHVTDWIEKKLSIEFQRIFVMPNMDDLVIPILLAGLPSDVIPTVPESDSTAV